MEIRAKVKRTFEKQKANNGVIRITTPNERIQKIESIITYIRHNRSEFHKAMNADLGRNNIDIDAEWLMVKAEAQNACKNLKKWMKPHKVKNSMLTMGTNSYYQYEAKGTVLILTPWNAPFAIPLVPIIGCIAAGNTAILKPSELSPHTSAFISDMIKALFAEEEIAVFNGDASVATALLELPFDHIFFTGGAGIGKIVMKAAAEHLSSVTLELGGKNPVIIDETASLENTASKIAWGKCANSGQACVAPDYILVHESVHDRLVELLTQEMTKMYNQEGKGFRQSPDYSRIINERHFDRIKALLDDAVSKGGKIEVGGESDRADRFIAPTVVTNTDETMRIMQEEIFGPLIAIKPYKDKREVIEYVRSFDKPLSLYIYSTDKANMDYFLKNTTSGNSVINNNMIQAGINPNLPFGGNGGSGMGRIVGKATFTAMSNERSIVRQPLGPMDFISFSFPPYSNLYKKILGYLAR